MAGPARRPVFSSTAGNARARPRGSAPACAARLSDERCTSAPLVGHPAAASTAATSSGVEPARYRRSVAGARRRMARPAPCARARRAPSGVATAARARASAALPPAAQLARPQRRAQPVLDARSAARSQVWSGDEREARRASAARHRPGSSSSRSSASASATGSTARSSTGPSAPNTPSIAAAREVDARQPAGQHLLRDQRVVGQRQRRARRSPRSRPTRARSGEATPRCS